MEEGDKPWGYSQFVGSKSEKLGQLGVNHPVPRSPSRWGKPYLVLWIPQQILQSSGGILIFKEYGFEEKKTAPGVILSKFTAAHKRDISFI